MHLIKFLILFKLNLKHKKKYFKFLYTKKLKAIINLFFFLNLIKFTKITNDIIYVWLNVSKRNKLLQNYKILYKASNKKKITIQTLKKLNAINYNKVIILSTSKGYLTNNQAVRYNVGGILFLKML